MKRGIRLGKLGTTVVCLAVGAALFAAGSAFAVAQPIVAADNTFSLAVYTMDQGDRPAFQNGGLNQHNATASANGPDAKPLFNTPTIGTGTTTLNGTQYLTTGSYGFICTIHPTTMIATLQVSASGTPTARPDIELKVTSKKIDKVASKGKLSVQVQAVTASEDVDVTAKLGNATLGKAENLNLAAGATQTVTMKLSKANKNKLAKRSKATVSVEGTVAFGAPTAAKGKLK